MLWKEERPCTVGDMWVSFMTSFSVPETESDGEAAHLALDGRAAQAGAGWAGRCGQDPSSAL